MGGLSEDRSNAGLIRAFYDARARNDLATVRRMLAEDVLWREPDIGNEHTGDLRGADAVLDMIREAQRLTGGTFELRVQTCSRCPRHPRASAAAADRGEVGRRKVFNGRSAGVTVEPNTAGLVLEGVCGAGNTTWRL